MVSPECGVRSPEASSDDMMLRATRSLGEPPGFRNSHLAYTRQPVAAEREGRRMRGVFPMIEDNETLGGGGAGAGAGRVDERADWPSSSLRRDFIWVREVSSEGDR